MHFFNPVPVLPLVELVPSLLTSPETVARAEAFCIGQLDKHIVHCKDRAGFVVNALLVPYLLAAIRMVESGFAIAADVDTGMVDGCDHPMGPLALCDLIGLDTIQFVAQSLYAEFKEPLYAPPSLLLRMVEAGLAGPQVRPRVLRLPGPQVVGTVTPPRDGPGASAPGPSSSSAGLRTRRRP